MILRHGLKVRGLEFRLFYPSPDPPRAPPPAKYGENRITFRPHFYFGETNQEIDFVFFLNGLPIVDLEVKHEKNQNVHDAVAQFAARDHARKIFQHPFLYLAADTSDVMAATDPRREENFRWHNMGLTNMPQDPRRVPGRVSLPGGAVEGAIAGSAVVLPRPRARARGGGRQAGAAGLRRFFPRYHQSRMVRKVGRHLGCTSPRSGDIGRKYLIDHSAGSGKTLSICWLAERLHSLFKPGTSEKLVDIVFILTDRKSLDTNIQGGHRELHALEGCGGDGQKAEDLPRFLKQRKSIIVTTQQKFAWVLDERKATPNLKKLRVAFLIDEAHRSQEGQMGVAIRLPFRKPDEPDAEAAGDTIPKRKRSPRSSASTTATNSSWPLPPRPPRPPSPSSAQPFDTYSEAEAIAEGYIVDVAASIISYKTLYNLHCHFVPKPDEETLYPKGVVAKALQNVAFQDDGLIQYKAEVMLRIFEDDVMPLIGGRAKAMIVTTSRVAGLRYFKIIKEKLKERGAAYKALIRFLGFRPPGNQRGQSASTPSTN